MHRLAGKVAIVTGGSRGVGKAVCVALARQGASVVVAAKTDEPNPSLPGTIHDTVRELESLGSRALAVKVNVRQEGDIQNMVEQTVRAFGKVDILINNAGAIHLADVQSTPAKKFDLLMDVNARAAYLCAREVFPHMKDGGHVVMMSPPIHPEKIGGKVAYGLSKLGMSIVAIGLAHEWRAQRVSVNALWPVTAVQSQATLHFGLGAPEQWRTADVLADAVVELVSTTPGMVTGQTLYDEDALRMGGITELDRYAVVPGTRPPPLSKLMFDE